MVAADDLWHDVVIASRGARAQNDGIIHLWQKHEKPAGFGGLFSLYFYFSNSGGIDRQFSGCFLALKCVG